MKCEACQQDIAETFLKKLLGTVVKDSKGKKHYICSNCQKTLGSKEHILESI